MLFGTFLPLFPRNSFSCIGRNGVAKADLKEVEATAAWRREVSKRCLEEADLDGDGVLTIDEFAIWWCGESGRNADGAKLSLDNTKRLRVMIEAAAAQMEQSVSRMNANVQQLTKHNSNRVDSLSKHIERLRIWALDQKILQNRSIIDRNEMVALKIV